MATSVKIAQKGKHWFITGASSGFGRLLAEYLLSLDAKVVATARKIETIQDLATRYPGSATVLQLDVTNQHSIDKAFADTVASVGYIDVLVNNAGYGVAGAIEEVSAEEYMPMFETNLFGLINVTKAFLPQFRARRSGAIINFSSIGGLIGSQGWGYYNSSKFALEGLSEALGAEMEPLGVHVMVVEPGPFRTDFLGRSGMEAKKRISDYETTAGKTREYFNTQSGKQPGDPQRAVEAVVAAVSDTNPPKHLLLGKLALRRLRKRLEDWNQELDKWQAVTEGADFPEA